MVGQRTLGFWSVTRTVPDPTPRLSKSRPQTCHTKATLPAPHDHGIVLNLSLEFQSQFMVQTAHKTVISGYEISHKVVPNLTLNNLELNYTHWPTKPSISPDFSIQTTLKSFLNSPKNITKLAQKSVPKSKHSKLTA